MYRVTNITFDIHFYRVGFHIIGNCYFVQTCLYFLMSNSHLFYYQFNNEIFRDTSTLHRVSSYV